MLYSQRNSKNVCLCRKFLQKVLLGSFCDPLRRPFFENLPHIINPLSDVLTHMLINLAFKEAISRNQANLANLHAKRLQQFVDFSIRILATEHHFHGKFCRFVIG